MERIPLFTDTRCRMGHYAAVKTGQLPVSSYEKTTPEGTLPGGVAVAVTASPETVGGRAAHAGVLGMPVGRVEGRLGHGRLGGRAAVPCSRRWHPPRPCSPQQEGHCGRPGNPCAGTGRTAGIATLKRPRGRKGFAPRPDPCETITGEHLAEGLAPPGLPHYRRPTPTREGGFGRDAGTGKLSAIYYRLRTGGFAASLGRSLRVALPHQPLSRLQARRVQPTHLSPMGAD